MYSIEIENLTKKFKEKTAVNNVSLKIKQGELFSLLGTNGAGKTTTIKMLSTLILPTSGNIKINGLDINKDKQKIKEILNVSPQETAIAMNLSVKENLEFMAGVYQIKNPKEKIDELVKTFKLEEVLNQKAKTLSGGWQRKVSIAIALINDPQILFLDEPTLGLDVIARRELWSIIESQKGKITIMLTTHYMEEAESLSDRVGIMAKGSLIDVGTPEELIEKSLEKIDNSIDLHRPYVDDIHIKCPKCGKTMSRVVDVIDCWFDSGSMPFAQYHYPFENKELWETQFPADFISEGIDQTRGWFYVLLIISTFVTGKSPFKNVLVNDLLLDKYGQKMHKSRGNAINPFEISFLPKLIE